MNHKARRGGPASRKRPSQQAVQQLVALCRAQRFPEAMPLAREFTRKWPGHAVGWHALAACAQATDEIDAAIRAHQKALAIEPENADARNNLGLLLVQKEQFTDAEKEYRRAVRLRPRFVHAWFNLGLLMSRLGRYDQAAECYRHVLQINPEFAEAYNSLGNDCRHIGDVPGAISAYRNALGVQPSNPDFHANLAISLNEIGCPKEAEEHYRQALSIAPREPRANNNFGLFLAGQYRWDEAEEAYRTALTQDPSNADIRVNLGNLLRDRGRRTAAEECYRSAIAIDSSRTHAWTELAHLLMESGELEEAEACHRHVCKLEPESVTAWRTLANALAMLGRRHEAMDAYNRALGIDAKDGESWYRLLQVQPLEKADSTLGTLREIVESPDSTDWNRMYGFYALGKAYADTEQNPESVIDCFKSAGHCSIQMHGDSAGEEIDTLKSIMSEVDAAFIERLAGSGEQDQRPIFIVGMPRSGTTLVEQILASHPDVHGAGERYDFERAVLAAAARIQSTFPQCVRQFSSETIGMIGNHYRQAVLDQCPDASRVTDKMPNNFRFLGLIALALPNSRIVHIEREPADTCLSCFERPIFGQHPPSDDLASLGRYYQAYVRLMDHWRSVLPAGRMLELQYEQLVTEPEPSIRTLLDHCGLAWDDRCLRSHETKRAVATASLGQVRQPIYTGSLGRWRRYHDALAPLFEALGPLAPNVSSSGPT